jgi:Family of unknown function (DUF6152)
VKVTRFAPTALALSLGLTLGLAGAPVNAHHSFAMYDMTKISTLEGTVQKFEWSNPHSWLFIAAMGPDGTETTYGFEMQSVGELLRRGWTKTAVRPGDKVKVSFHPFRDGSPAGQFQNVWTSDGTLIGKPMGPGGGGGGAGVNPILGGSAPQPQAAGGAGSAPPSN